MPKKKLKTVLDTLSDKLIADTVRKLPAKERAPLEALCMNRALIAGEITVPDGEDLPPKLRAANLERIKAIQDPKVRDEMLHPKTPPVVAKRGARAKKLTPA